MTCGVRCIPLVSCRHCYMHVHNQHTYLGRVGLGITVDDPEQRHQGERENQFQNRQEVGFLLAIHEHMVEGGVCVCVVHVCMCMFMCVCVCGRS